MPRYSVSGVNSTILDATVDATGDCVDITSVMGGQAVMGTNLKTDRVLWLRSFWAYNSGAGTIRLCVHDATVGTNILSANRRFTLACASGETTSIDFPAPGLKFETGCVVSKETTDGSASFQPGTLGGNGYEE